MILLVSLAPFLAPLSFPRSIPVCYGRSNFSTRCKRGSLNSHQLRRTNVGPLPLVPPRIAPRLVPYIYIYIYVGFFAFISPATSHFLSLSLYTFSFLFFFLVAHVHLSRLINPEEDLSNRPRILYQSNLLSHERGGEIIATGI